MGSNLHNSIDLGGFSMAVWTRIRSLWENEGALTSTAEALLFRFKKMQEQYPERDPNAWLAWALGNQPGWGHADKLELLSLAAPYSITEPEQATGLLALDVVAKEYPELGRAISEKHAQLYLPVDVAVKNGSFLKRWRETNPWTDDNYPAVEQGLRRGLLSGTSSRAVAKIEITCPHCRVELRIPGITGGKKVRCPGCKSVFSVDP